MKKQIYIFLLISGCFLCFGNSMYDDTFYRYADGNGNGYIINSGLEKSIEYIPMKPDEISTYDGGEYKKKVINEDQYKSMIALLEEIVKKEDIMSKQRMKGASMITIQKNDSEKNFIIKPGSKEIEHIETKLKELMGN